MNEYIITIYRRGKTKVTRFKTLKAAIACREQIFQATGVVVGIEELKLSSPPADIPIDSKQSIV